MERLVDYSCNR